MLKLAKRGYFLRLFFSALLLLAFSLSASLLVYRRAAALLREEAERTNSTMLNEFAGILNERVADAVSLTLSGEKAQASLDNAVLLDRIGHGFTLTERYEIYKSMKALYQSQYLDLFLYLKNSGLVCSARRTNTDAATYFAAYYAGTEMNAALLEGFIDARQNRHVFRWGDDGRLAVLQTLPTTTERQRTPNAVIVCVLKPSNIAGQLASLSAAGSCALVLNAQGETLFSTLPGQPVVELPDGDGSLLVDGSEYLVTRNVSSDTGLTCVLLTPASYFWSRAESLRRAGFVIFFAFLTAGLSVSLLLARNNYKPINTLLSDVVAKCPATAPLAESDDLSCIRHLLFTTLDEKERHSAMLRSAFVARALQGRVEGTPDLVAAFREYGISLLSESFIVLTLKPEPATRPVSEALLNDALEQALDALRLPYSGILVSHFSGLFTYLINPCLRASLPPAQIGGAILAELRRREEPFTLALSDRREGWQGLRLAYEQSLSLLKERAVCGPGCLICSSDLPARAFCYSFAARETGEALMQCVADGSPEPARLLSDVRARCCPFERLLPDEFLSYARDMCELLSRLSPQLGLTSEELELLRSCDTLPEFEQALAEFLDVLHARRLQICRDQEAEGEKRLCEQILAFIEENLSDPGLCVQSIGARFGLSGAYLSKRFKAQTGRSVTNAIADRRIALACRLLTETSDSLAVVASRVGFIDSSALIRSFKKTMGLTPGEYRRLYCPHASAL